MWRFARLAIHLIQGVLTVLLAYPLCDKTVQRRARGRWSRRLLAILNVEVRVEEGQLEKGCMIVANHVSWLDIFVINALAPAAFVAKADVRSWPCIGWLAARNDTVFLRRGSRGHAKIISGEIASYLEAGHDVAIFPEGTTTDGTHVQHFHAALLQPAIDAGHPIQPAALRYRHPDGSYCRSPAYDGDISLLQSLSAIVSTPRIVAAVRALPPVSTVDGINRRELANTARDAIATIVEQRA